MKHLAYTAPDYQGELITIDEALRRRQFDPDRWEGRIYYDIIRSRPMIAVKREGKGSSFSYQGGAGGGHRRGSKGIAHELAQEYLCKQTLFKFSLFNMSFIITLEATEDEVRIVDPSNPNRFAYVDVMLPLLKSLLKIFKTGSEAPSKIVLYRSSSSSVDDQPYPPTQIFSRSLAGRTPFSTQGIR